VYQHTSVGSTGSKKTRVWKNLKQIVAADKALPWGPDDTTCEFIIKWAALLSGRVAKNKAFFRKP